MKSDSKYYWIRLRTDFFDSDEIDFLMAQPNGCQYIVLYQMLCLSTANNAGELATRIGDVMIPYDVKKIVRDTKYFDVDTVAVALELFKNLGLIYEADGSILRISHFSEMVGSESASKEAVKKRAYRARLRDKAEDIEGDKEGDNLSDRDKEIKRLENRDKEIRDRDRDKEKEVQGENISCQQIAGLYNETCVSFPRLTSLSDARKKAIKARLRFYSLEDFKRLFEKAEASSFLKGQNSRNWSANFDWLIKDSNMAKVLDGNYDDRSGGSGGLKNRVAEQLDSSYMMFGEWAESEEKNV